MPQSNIAAQNLVSDLDRDGFIVVRSALDRELVEQARRDLEAIYAKDLEERRTNKFEKSTFLEGSTKSVLSPVSHLVLGLPGKSKALDQCYETIFSDPTLSELIRGIGGDFIKIRDVNCRYMTGAHDPGNFLNPPHEWHRDSPGEFCIAIPLNEVPEGDNGATAVVPGSHRFPWCPRWNALFGAPFYIKRKPLMRAPSFLTRFNLFNRLLHKRYLKSQTGTYAEPGDIYIFLNDTWHGRVPNVHGARPMIVMAGAFPTDFAFPDNPEPFPADAIESLPPSYRQAVSRDAPVNTNKDTIVHRMLNDRKADKPTDLFWWARKEREIMVKTSSMALSLIRVLPQGERLVRKLAAR